MIKFEYKSFLCREDDLEKRLNTYGEEGWQLHSSEPVVTVGMAGAPDVSFSVIMAKVIDIQIQENVEESSVEDDAIRCRG